MNTVSVELAMPMLGMMVLTGLVWIYLFVQRVGYASANKLDIEDMKSPGDVENLIPAASSSASHNFRNLCEIPVVFYAICLYLTVFGGVDRVHVYCAWVFLGFRVLHSLIHCSYNRVLHRFIAYMISSLAMWVMVARAALAMG